MVATLFFNAGGDFTLSDSHSLTVNEGVRIEIPCVQSAIFFEQSSDGDLLLLKNWGIKISASQVSQSTNVGCEFSLGRITVEGPVATLKNPTPGFKKRWSAKTVSSMKLKGSLPTAKAAKKPLSALVSLEFGSFFAGFAAVGLETSCETSDSGAESFLVQACFSPVTQKDFTFFLGSTLALSRYGGTKSNQFFSVTTFRPSDSLVNLLNVGQLSKSWGRTTLTFQDSFSAGLSRYKNGISFCNDALISLSGKGFFFSVGCFCADFGYVTSSGTEILEPFQAYGSFSYSFKTGGAKIGVNGACATGISYDAGNSVTESGAGESGAYSTSVMCGVSVSKDGFSVSAEGSVKNLCPKDDFSDAECTFVLKIGFEGSSLQLDAKSPLFFVDVNPVWQVTLNAGGSENKMISGSVSGKFEGFEFS